MYYASETLSGRVGGSIPPVGTRAVWEYADFCRPSTCPKCRRPVFFVRHNGGSVWFDALGKPWPKHPCMASEPDMAWLQRGFPGGIDTGNRTVFGIIREAIVSDPGVSAHFVISCADGTIIEDEFVYTLNPCEAIGGLVKLELTPDNRVGARKFKAIEDMLEAHKARLAAEERLKRSNEKRRNTLADRDDPPMTVVATHPYGRGTIKLRMVMDVAGGSVSDIDYAALQLITTKVKIEIMPDKGNGGKLAISLSASDAVKLIGGVPPSVETYESIYKAVCARKGILPPMV